MMKEKEEEKKISLSNLIPLWELGDVIATGSTCVVHSGKVYRDGVCTPVAIKTAPISRASPLKMESGILYMLRGNPNILHCFSSQYTDNLKTGQEFYHLLLELCPRGSLTNLIRARGPSHPLPEYRIRSYTRSILRGLCYMHAKGYVHCDIKPDNILVCNDMDVKIADFGWAKRVQEPSPRGIIRGTLQYVAPESYLREEYESRVDVWALGCVVVEMASGKSAWKFRLAQGEEGIKQASLMIGMSYLLPEFPIIGLSEVGSDFLSKCLVKDPYKRWTAQMLLNHPFVAGPPQKNEEEDNIQEEEEEEEIVLKGTGHCGFQRDDEEEQKTRFQPLRGVYMPQCIC